AEGNVPLRADNVRFGAMQSQQGRIIFRTSPLAPEADGSFVVAEYQLQTGPPLPISVRLEKAGEPSPGEFSNKHIPKNGIIEPSTPKSVTATAAQADPLQSACAADMRTIVLAALKYATEH